MIIWRHIRKYILIERMQMTKQKKYSQLIYKVSKNVDDRKPYENFTSDINKQFIGKKNANYSYLYEKMLNRFHNKRNTN